MLSYQHGYHAGNLADVHKHAVLATVLEYLTRKDKPLSYLESHGGRGLYDLAAPEAVKTGEAAQGIEAVADWFAAEHPYARALAEIRAAHGPTAYPGSPLLAATLLRPADRLRIAELHPQEHAALSRVLGKRAQVQQTDGLLMLKGAVPPDPRRGLALIDPSYEVKSDYDAMAALLPALHRRWAVGLLILWYPLLEGAPHTPMLTRLQNALPDATRHEVRFPPARPGHRMIGSGLFIVNPTFGLDAELDRLGTLFAGITG